jgi:hypothetical protein
MNKKGKRKEYKDIYLLECPGLQRTGDILGQNVNHVIGIAPGPSLTHSPLTVKERILSGSSSSNLVASQKVSGCARGSAMTTSRWLKMFLLRRV